jgi:outer membrane protein assembly factor BamE (lipoprotein component of BamABCDE complex)
MNRFLIIVIVNALFFAVLACQTSRAKEVQGIHVGMAKDQVLEAAGNPTRTDRKSGQDRWMYVIPEETQDAVTEVRFTEGRVTYVGAPLLPKISAEEQDKLNEDSTAQIARRRALEALKDDEPQAKSQPQFVPLDSAPTSDQKSAQ